MAMSKDILPSELDWVHELAKNEINPEENNIFNAVNQFDPKQIIEESSIVFLEELRDLFTTHARVFNGYSEGTEKFSDIKIYGITNTAADFMLFRNNVKLVFANTAHGIINVSFVQHMREDLNINGNSVKNQFQESSGLGAKASNDIIAQIGPFLDVIWTYQGEKVNSSRLLKYYFVEFVKISRVAKKELPNHLLLKQIKALLQDKGIDL